MNTFEKSQAAKILACYAEPDDLEKAHPVGYINAHGKQKQADGSYKYIGKPKNNAAVHPPTPTTIEEAPQISSPLTPTLTHSITTGFAAVDKILKASEAIVAKFVSSQREKAEQDGYKFTDRDAEYCELDAISSLIKALYTNIKPTDDVTNIQPTFSKGNVEIRCTILRDGKAYPLETHTIVAQGSVQRAHYRYLTSTPLPKEKNTHSNPADNLIKKLNKREKIELEIKHLVAAAEREQKSAEAKNAMSDQDIIRESHKYWYDRFGTGPKFEYLNEYGKEGYGTPEAYEASIKLDNEKAIASTRHSAKVAAKYASDLLKQADKKKNQLKELENEQ